MIDLIGNTPLVEISPSLHNTSNKIYAKLEYFNPTKSLKDRVALAMIKNAESAGLINRDSTLIEPTSGNMGISLAFIGGLFGYKVILTMSEAMSVERRNLIKHYGAELVLTKKELGFNGAIDEAYRLSKNIENSVVLNQYKNPANFEIHRTQTGEEIYNQLPNIDMFVAGAGTGACISGVSACIKAKKDLHSVAVEPTESDILSGGEKWSPHSLQGIGPNFIPENFKKQYIDEILNVSKNDAYNFTKFLAKNAGIDSGISGGANGFAAFEVAKKHSNKNICFMVCDSCERYMSTDLFS